MIFFYSSFFKLIKLANLKMDQNFLEKLNIYSLLNLSDFLDIIEKCRLDQNFI